MKYFGTLSIWLFVFFLVNNFANAQNPDWVQKGKFPDGYGVKDFHFLDSISGFAISSLGEIWRTQDGGRNWQLSHRQGFADLTDIDFLDSQNGIVVGDSGTVVKTTNGGTTWTKLNFLNKKYLRSAKFVSNNILVIGGDSGYIYRSINAGLSFIKFKAPTTTTFVKIYYFPNNIGYFLGGNQILYKTLDGLSTIIDSELGFTTNLFMFSSDVGYKFTGGSGMLATTNGFTTYTYRSISTFNQSSSDPINDVSFITPDTGFVCDNGGKNFRTYNGGQTWFYIPVLQGNPSFYKSTAMIKAFSSKKVYIYGFLSIGFQRSSTGGQTWSRTTGNKLSADLCHLYLHGSRIWSCGYFGTLQYSDDQGLNWTSPQQFRDNLVFRNIHFFNSANGIVLADSGVFHRTTNGGQNWVKSFIGKVIKPSSLIKIDGSSLLVFYGTDTGAFFTPDMGLTWTKRKTPFPVNDSWKTASGRIFCTSKNNIFYTDNLGQSWTIAFTANHSGNQHMGKLTFFGEQFGWAFTTFGPTYITVNGGQSWQLQENSDGHTLLSSGNNSDYVNRWSFAQFQSPTQGIFLGRGYYSDNWRRAGRSYLANTSNGGVKWDMKVPPVNLAVTGGLQDSLGYYWIYGEYCGIYKSAVPYPIVTSTQDQLSLKESELGQNFPNPFREETRIPYQLVRPADVSLHIHDMQGRLIFHQPEGAKDAGAQEILLNSPLPSGIYYYQLWMGDRVKTRKMVVE